MHDLPFALGLKTRLDWRSQPADSRLPCLSGALESALTDRGYAFLELAVDHCRDAGEAGRIRREAEQCGDAGLAVFLHPYLAGAANAAFWNVTPEPAATADAILAAASGCRAATGRECRVVLHPATRAHNSMPRGVRAERAGLVERSRAFFAHLADNASADHPGVRIEVEHQLATRADEAIIRTGDTWREVLRVVDGLDVGVCLDTGHYILAVERHGQEAMPPGDFLRRVEHVHIHAVVEGVDHCLITPDSPMVADLMRGLLAEGFRGTVTLEYSWDALLSAGSVEAVLDQSRDVLSAWCL
jgi:sugar phosphate isomerase/epimerase